VKENTQEKLKIKNISLSFLSVAALSNISFDVYKGEQFFFKVFCNSNDYKKTLPFFHTHIAVDAN